MRRARGGGSQTWRIWKGGGIREGKRERERQREMEIGHTWGVLGTRVWEYLCSTSEREKRKRTGGVGGGGGVTPCLGVVMQHGGSAAGGVEEGRGIQGEGIQGGLDHLRQAHSYPQSAL